MQYTPDPRFMRMAIEKAREGVLEGQSPFGAVIVKDGKVVACEHNIVWATTDITAHAEVTAIRAACKALDTIDLTDCEIYSTTEPCPMCFSASHWARIAAICYGTSIADAKEAGFNELTVSNELMKSQGGSNIEIFPNFLREECVKLFDFWKSRNTNPVY